jgi:P27 family predicted phage terminase small subunit
MPSRGRPPKPTKLKLVEGNPGKRALRQEPKPPPSRPVKPAWLPAGIAKGEWDRVTPILDELGVLSVLDRTALATYCIAVAGIKAATDDLRIRGYLIPSAREDGALIKNPSNQLLRDYAKLVAQFSAMLGMSPADRVRLTGDAGVHGGELGLEALLR